MAHNRLILQSPLLTKLAYETVKDDIPEADIAALYNKEPAIREYIIAADLKESKSSSQAVAPFIIQFNQLVTHLGTWGRENKCSNDNLALNIAIFKTQLFEKSYSGIQSKNYFETIKLNLELIILKLNDTQYPLTQRQDAFIVLCSNLGVCAPGLYTHIEDILHSFSKNLSVTETLKQFRRNLVKLYASRHIAEYKVDPGNQIHVNNAFNSYAVDCGWTLSFSPSSVKDIFTVHLDIKPSHLLHFQKYCLAEYNPTAIFEWLIHFSEVTKDETYTEYEKRLNRFINDLGIAEYKCSEYIALDDDGVTYKPNKTKITAHIVDFLNNKLLVNFVYFDPKTLKHYQLVAYDWLCNPTIKNFYEASIWDTNIDKTIYFIHRLKDFLSEIQMIQLLEKLDAEQLLLVLDDESLSRYHYICKDTFELLFPLLSVSYKMQEHPHELRSFFTMCHKHGLLEKNSVTGESRLLAAADKQNKALLQGLIEAKADLNLIDANGNTALSIAYKRNFFNGVKVLLSAKAEVKLSSEMNASKMIELLTTCNPEDSKVLSALNHLMSEQKNLSFSESDFITAETLHDELTLYSLKNQETYVEGMPETKEIDDERWKKLFASFYKNSFLYDNIREKHKPPLIFAISQYNLRLAKALIEAKSDVNVTYEQNPGKHVNALTYALNISSFDCANLLIESKADIQVNKTLDVLHGASREGNIKVLNILINAKADVNGRDVLGSTPLGTAVYCNQLESLKLLISAKADVNESQSNGTVLSQAYKKGSADCVKELLAAEAKLPKSGVKPFDLFLLIKEREKADPATIKALKQIILQKNKYFDDLRYDFPYHEFAIVLKYLREILYTQFVPIFSPYLAMTPENESKIDVTELTNICREYQEFAILDHSPEDEFDSSMVIQSIEKNNLTCLKILLDAKANVTKALKNSILKGTSEAVTLVLKYQPLLNVDLDYEYPINYAVKLGDSKKINILVEAKADLNVYCKYTEGFSPLGKAICNANFAVMQALVEAKADINYRCYGYMKPAMFQLIESDIPEKPLYLKFLIENKANINLYHEGDSVLMAAMSKRDADCVQKLVMAKANINVSQFGFYNTLSQDPFYIACANENITAVRTLLAAGARVTYPFPDSIFNMLKNCNPYEPQTIFALKNLLGQQNKLIPSYVLSASSFAEAIEYYGKLINPNMILNRDASEYKPALGVNYGNKARIKYPQQISFFSPGFNSRHLGDYLTKTLAGCFVTHNEEKNYCKIMRDPAFKLDELERVSDCLGDYLARYMPPHPMVTFSEEYKCIIVENTSKASLERFISRSFVFEPKSKVCAIL